MGTDQLSGYVPYSAISGNDNVISSINGSGISGNGGGADMSAVSAVASSYAQSAASGKVDQSAFDDCCSAMSAAVSAKLDSSAFTSYTATATAGGRTYTGVTPIVVDNNNDTISLSANAVNLDSSLKSYLSGGSGYIGLTYPVRLVTQSSQATGSDIIYIVTGSN